jgi:hypothetical protein
MLVSMNDSNFLIIVCTQSKLACGEKVYKSIFEKKMFETFVFSSAALPLKE